MCDASYRYSHWFSRALCALAVMLAAFLLHVPAGFAATELIISVEKLEDRSASLTVEDVVNLPFEPASQVLAEGYRSPVYWLRIKVAPSPDGSDGVMLVRPTILDNVTLFQRGPANDGDWTVHPASGAYAPEAQVWPSTQRTFRLPPSTTEVEYYLRVESVGTIAAYISVLPFLDARLLGLQVNINPPYSPKSLEMAGVLLKAV